MTAVSLYQIRQSIAKYSTYGGGGLPKLKCLHDELESCTSSQLYDFTDFISCVMRNALCSLNISTACTGKTVAAGPRFLARQVRAADPVPDKLTSGPYFTTLSAHTDSHVKIYHHEE